jgi:hypothetical protein
MKIYLRKAITLRDDRTGTERKLDEGINEVPEEVAEHWHVKSNTVKGSRELNSAMNECEKADLAFAEAEQARAEAHNKLRQIVAASAPEPAPAMSTQQAVEAHSETAAQARQTDTATAVERTAADHAAAERAAATARGTPPRR